MRASAEHRVRQIRRRLLDFYDEERRELPWRETDDPYRIWVSEVMLQQTRVETVIPYYKRWMERFPGLDELAEADQEEVLQEWKGLGYYARARNLHRAARLVRERHDGRIPRSAAALRELPGIGEYTAGAVASIAFGEAQPAVDGNARRVLSRLDDLSDPTRSTLRDRASVLLDEERPAAFNQALMELGARICTPSAPDCGRCPVEAHCLARERGTVDQRPPPRKRSPVEEREVAVGVPVGPRGRTLLVRRPEDGLLGGMWEFPSCRPGDDEAAAEAACRALRQREVAPASGNPPALEPVVHAFSHLRVTYRTFVVPVSGYPPGGDGDGDERVRVHSLDALDELPLPVAQQKIGVRARRGLAKGILEGPAVGE